MSFFVIVITFSPIFFCSFFFWFCVSVVFVLLIYVLFVFFFFFTQKTAYEMRISDGSSDVCSSDLPSLTGKGMDRFDVFTTRPDTMFGASFAAISPEHPLADALGKSDDALAAFIAECRATGTAAAEIETAEKKGYDTGLSVIHPLDPDRKLPLFVANIVLLDYGTGAVFGCPAHDQRDLDFARKYQLPVTLVVSGEGGAQEPNGDEAYTGPSSAEHTSELQSLMRISYAAFGFI